MRPLSLLLVLLAAAGCRTPSAATSTANDKSASIEIDQAALVNALVLKNGEDSRARAERGIRQVAAFWRAGDGDIGVLRNFVEESFLSDPQQLDMLHQRFSL